MHLKVGLLGYGHWGPNLANCTNATAGAELHTICDVEEANLARAKERHPSVRLSRDLNDMLADTDLDAILVSSPTASHYEHGRQVLEAGKHVFIEKPVATRASEGDELVRLAARHDRVLMVGYVFLYNPAVERIKEMIDQGDLGTIYYVTSTRVNLGPLRNDVPALWDLAPHDISFINYWFGARPTAVRAGARTFLASTMSDFGFLDLEYPGNRHAHTIVSWLSPRKDRGVTVVGSRRMLTWDDLSVSEPIQVYDKGITETVERRGGETFVDFKATTFDGDILIPKVPIVSPLQLEIAHFVDCIRTGQRPRSDGAVATEITRTLEAADRSVDTGSRVEIEY